MIKPPPLHLKAIKYIHAFVRLGRRNSTRKNPMMNLINAESPRDYKLDPEHGCSYTDSNPSSGARRDATETKLRPMMMTTSDNIRLINDLSRQNNRITLRRELKQRCYLCRRTGHKAASHLMMLAPPDDDEVLPHFDGPAIARHAMAPANNPGIGPVIQHMPVPARQEENVLVAALPPPPPPPPAPLLPLPGQLGGRFARFDLWDYRNGIWLDLRRNPRPPIPPPPPPPPAQGVVVEPEPADVRLSRVYWRMYHRATLLWLQGPCYGAEQLHNITHVCANIANSSDLHTYGVNVADYVSTAVTFAQRNAATIRIRDGRTRSQMEGITYWRLFKMGYLLRFYPDLNVSNTRLIDELQLHDNGVPWSRTMLTLSQKAVYRVGMYLRLTKDALLEELTKRAVGNAYDPTGDKSEQWHNWSTPPAGACMGGVLLAYGDSLNGTGATVSPLRVLGHAMLAALPLWKGVLAHTMWNAFIFEMCGSATQQNSFNQPISRFMRAQRWHSSVARIDARTVTDMCLAEHRTAVVEVDPACTLTLLDGEVCRPSFGVRRVFGIEGIQPTVFRSCTHNEQIALRGRVIRVRPHYNAGVDQFWANVIPLVAPHVVALVGRVQHPMAKIEWVCSFPGSKREMYERVRRWAEQPVRNPADSAFIKREVAARRWTDLLSDDMPIKDPRLVRSSPPRYNIHVGPWTKPLAKRVRDGLLGTSLDNLSAITREAIEQGHQIAYTCGMTGERVGETLYYAILAISSMVPDGDDIVFIEDDQSRFDMHLSAGAFSFLNAIYSQTVSRKCAALLRRGDSTRGVTRRGIKYTSNVGMQSGWPDTSVGDTLVNVAMKYFINGFGRPWFTIMCGDDSVTVTTKSHMASIGGLPAVHAMYRRFGMDVVISVRDHVLDVEFCSGRFIRTSSYFVLVPKVGKLLAKLGWDQKDRNMSDQLAWARGIAHTLKQFGHYDPILSVLSIQMMSQLGIGRIIKERNDYEKYVDCSQQVRLCDLAEYYSHNYSLDMREVGQISNLMRSYKFGVIFPSVQFERLLEKDI